MFVPPLIKTQIEAGHFLTVPWQKWFNEQYEFFQRLIDDEEDLTQYLRTDGTRELTDNWGVGYKKITELADGSNDSDAVNYGQLLEAGGEGIFRFIPQDSDPPTETGVNIAFMRTGDYDYIYMQNSDGTLRRIAIGYVSE
jgi:hypothetical protein